MQEVTVLKKVEVMDSEGRGNTHGKVKFTAAACTPSPAPLEPCKVSAKGLKTFLGSHSWKFWF